jgi:thymidylate synthase ThyX
LYFKFRQEWLYRQAEHTQNEVKDARLTTAIIPAEPPEHPSIVSNFAKNKLHKRGLVPEPLASTPPQNERGRTGKVVT